ncbi:MAG: phosphoglycerate kinase [Myxococcales bacterium]|nr:phosphoglycerate kinase [Myxococcales bacterium]
MRTLSESSIEWEGKRVFCRVDFNVPLTPAGEVADDERIVQALPTLRYLLERNAKLVVASHLGRPKGKVRKQFSLEPVAVRLQQLLGNEIVFAEDCVGDGIAHVTGQLKNGQILLLENLRFHSGEEKGDEGFARQLAQQIDVYVGDAFGAAHRSHASVTGLVPFVEDSFAGLLMTKEVQALSRITRKPQTPFVAVLGGAKVSDKLGVLKRLIQKVDVLMIGGAMAYTFLRAQGQQVGSSRVEDDLLDVAKNILETAAARGVQLLLPVDHVAAESFDENAPHRVVGINGFEANEMGLDIGPQTQKNYQDALNNAGTVFWNGPMGVFEWDVFSHGTMAVMDAVANSAAFTVVGGGDSVAALKKGGAQDKIGHVSTGGGAGLEFLETGTLPGLEILGFNRNA